jgi:hypothetical protein
MSMLNWLGVDQEYLASSKPSLMSSISNLLELSTPANALRVELLCSQLCKAICLELSPTTQLNLVLMN